MPSRAELNIRARNVGIDPATYPNDSKLEQRVIYEEKNNATFAGVLATGTLTSDATNQANNETTTIGDRVYTWKTALTEAIATATLTSNATAPSNGTQVAVGDQTYTFRTALTVPAVPYEVLIGASAAIALDNLKLAINQGGTNYPTAVDNSGVGTTWSAGTIRHPNVNATTNTNTTQVVAANLPGTEGNKLTVGGQLDATLSWSGTNLTGGVNPVQDEIKIGADAATSLDYLKDAINATAVVGGPGVGYSTGTKAHQDVTATTNTNTTQLVQAISPNGGNLIVTTETGAHIAWGAGTLASGTPKEVAAVAADNAQISGGARV